MPDDWSSARDGAFGLRYRRRIVVPFVEAGLAPIQSAYSPPSPVQAQPDFGLPQSPLLRAGRQKSGESSFVDTNAGGAASTMLLMVVQPLDRL